MDKIDKKLKELGFFKYSETDKTLAYLKQGVTGTDGRIERPVRVQIVRDISKGNHQICVFVSDNSCRFGDIHCAAPLSFVEFRLFEKKLKKLVRKWWVKDHIPRVLGRFLRRLGRKE